MFRSQLDQVRSQTDNFADRAAGILAARRERAMLAPAPPSFGTMEMATEGMVGAEADGHEAFPLELMPEALGHHGMAEAIVLAELRPAFFVFDTAIDVTDAVEAHPDLLRLVTDNQATLLDRCLGGGRVDLMHHWAPLKIESFAFFGIARC